MSCGVGGPGDVSKKKKVRVAFKKNRQKRTRANDLTGQFGREAPKGGEPASGERVRAKGELSRHRTVMQDDVEGGDVSGTDPISLLSVDLSACAPGRVIRVHGLDSIVAADDGREYRCRVRRLLKT